MSMMRAAFIISLFACLFLLILTPGDLFAQTASTGVVAGVVTDVQHGVVPGATVTLSQKGTNVSQTATTDAAGDYSSHDTGNAGELARQWHDHDVAGDAFDRDRADPERHAEESPD